MRHYRHHHQQQRLELNRQMTLDIVHRTILHLLVRRSMCVCVCVCVSPLRTIRRITAVVSRVIARRSIAVGVVAAATAVTARRCRRRREARTVVGIKRRHLRCGGARRGRRRTIVVKRLHLRCGGVCRRRGHARRARVAVLRHDDACVARAKAAAAAAAAATAASRRFGLIAERAQSVGLFSGLGFVGLTPPLGLQRRFGAANDVVVSRADPTEDADDARAEQHEQYDNKERDRRPVVDARNDAGRYRVLEQVELELDAVGGAALLRNDGEEKRQLVERRIQGREAGDLHDQLLIVVGTLERFVLKAKRAVFVGTRHDANGAVQVHRVTRFTVLESNCVCRAVALAGRRVDSVRVKKVFPIAQTKKKQQQQQQNAPTSPIS